MIAWRVIALALIAAPPAWAWPVLSEGRRTPAGWCYRDHQEANLWWLVPATADILTEDGRPDIHMTVFNYTGTREMGDLGDARSGAVLQFGIGFPAAGGRIAEARRSLGSGASVRPLIPEIVEAEVVFAGVNSVRQATSSEEDPEGEAGAWTERRFALGLTPEETAVVTEAWRERAIILSINLTASARACAARPPRGSEAAPELTTILADAIPVTLDVSLYADAVRVIELDATMPAGYTSTEVGCTELASSRGFSDVARVIVVIEAEAMNGDRISRQIRFTRDSPTTQVARFDRAVRLDSGYVLRVSRVYASGRTEDERPRRIEVWQGFEDVCAIEAGRTVALDPRMLY